MISTSFYFASIHLLRLSTRNNMFLFYCCYKTCSCQQYKCSALQWKCNNVLPLHRRRATKYFVMLLTILTYLLTYLLTPWCRVLLEKLTGLQLVKKFPAFHVTRRFITALTSVRHLSLSWARPIQSIYPHPTSWRSTHLSLGLPSGLLPSGFLSKTLYTPISSPTRIVLSPEQASRM